MTPDTAVVDEKSSIPKEYSPIVSLLLFVCMFAGWAHIATCKWQDPKEWDLEIWKSDWTLYGGIRNIIIIIITSQLHTGTCSCWVWGKAKLNLSDSPKSTRMYEMYVHVQDMAHRRIMDPLPCPPIWMCLCRGASVWLLLFICVHNNIHPSRVIGLWEQSSENRNVLGMSTRFISHCFQDKQKN